MSIFKFLTSKTFFKHLAIALAILVVFVFAIVSFLDFRTQHGEEEMVPDLSKMQVIIAKEKLEAIGLELILLDTVDFRKDMPPYSIVEQDPKAEIAVKDGRKVYVKVNAGGYNDITLPSFKDKTYRQVSANLKSLGLVEGNVTYKAHIAKDVVLEISQRGKVLKAGDKVKKNSTIDFILGDGKTLYSETLLDDADTIITTTETSEENVGE